MTYLLALGFLVMLGLVIWHTVQLGQIVRFVVSYQDEIREELHHLDAVPDMRREQAVLKEMMVGMSQVVAKLNERVGK